MSVTPTIIRFCHDAWSMNSSVQMLVCEPKLCYVVTQATPFHPMSHIWPDHPADRGLLDEYPVVDCQVGAVDMSSQRLFIGRDIPVRRNQDGWRFVVVHCIENTEVSLSVGQQVSLKVDKSYQQALSRGHSAGHIASLALNKVLAEQGYWRKDAERKDTHGYYDFNSYAQQTSIVSEEQCLDTYRLGKTLRKRGLNSAEFLSDIKGVEERINSQIAQWLTLGSDISIKCCGETLTDSRYWQCDLGEGKLAEMPCGGTHARSLKEYTQIRVELTCLDEQSIEMKTLAFAAK